MKLLPLLYSCLFLCSSVFCTAQANYAELEQDLAKSPSDSITKSIYYKLTSLAWSVGDWENAKKYTNDLTVLCEKTEDIDNLIISWTHLAYTYRRMELMDSAGLFYRKALHKTEALNHKGPSNSRLYDHLTFFYNEIGEVDSMEIFREKVFNQPCLYREDAVAKENVVALFYNKKETKKIFNGLHAALDCSITINRPKESCSILDKLAKYAAYIHNYELAIEYTTQILTINNELKDSVSIASCYQTLGLINNRLEDHNKSLEWFKKAVTLNETIAQNKDNYKANLLMSGMYYNLASSYQGLEEYDSAYIFLKKSIDLQPENEYTLARSIYSMADVIMAMKGDPQTALDSLLSAEKIMKAKEKKITYIQILKGKAYRKLKQYDKAERCLLGVIESLKKRVNRTPNLRAYSELRYLYLETKDYKKAYDYQFLITEIERELKAKDKQNSSLRFEIKYESEKLKRTNLRLEKDNELQAQELAFNETLNSRNQSIILILIALMFLLAGIAWLVYRQKRLKTEFKIMRLEQKALKAQINPHFFFNVLNSLQGTILSEEPMVAYKYHTKFTKLMRLILMQSNSEGIVLSEEIEALRLYLELEQLRTGSAFSFEIVNAVSKNDQLIVPSMLLQPFVENAIWHGVMNREEEEEKKIIIRIHNKNNQIDCEIEDTGVGRTQAQLIKEQKTNKHKSMGMKVTQNRLELFQLRYKMPLTFGIQDLLSSSGQILGTKVRLEIPVIK